MTTSYRSTSCRTGLPGPPPPCMPQKKQSLLRCQTYPPRPPPNLPQSNNQHCHATTQPACTCMPHPPGPSAAFHFRPPLGPAHLHPPLHPPQVGEHQLSPQAPPTPQGAPCHPHDHFLPQHQLPNGPPWPTTPLHAPKKTISFALSNLPPPPTPQPPPIQQPTLPCNNPACLYLHAPPTWPISCFSFSAPPGACPLAPPPAPTTGRGTPTLTTGATDPPGGPVPPP